MHRVTHLSLLPLLSLLITGCSPDEQATEQQKALVGSVPVFQDHNAEHKTWELQGFGKDLSQQAIRITDNIYQTRSTSNANMVVTPAGNVLIDTGLAFSSFLDGSFDHKKAMQAANDNKITHIIATHAHGDHYGTTPDWLEDKPEIITHYEFNHNQEYLVDLIPYLMPRNRIFYPEDIPELGGPMMGLVKNFYPKITPSITVADGDPYEFEVGGTQFVVYPTPGAEGPDGLSVWLPEQKILFTGDLYGHIFGMWPNLTTMRGERPRYPKPYIKSLDLVLELEPEIIIPSHFYPVKGKQFIKKLTKKTRDAVAYVDDAVIEGMNEGKDVYTLMEEVKLPEDLQLNEVHGKVSWAVRSIWEAYQGWFYHNSATEMYSVPLQDVYPEMVEMIGGAQQVLKKAEQLFAAQKLEKSLHLAEMALSVEPENKAALTLQLKIYDALLERSGKTNHHEIGMLEHLSLKTQAKI